MEGPGVGGRQAFLELEFKTVTLGIGESTLDYSFSSISLKIKVALVHRYVCLRSTLVFNVEKQWASGMLVSISHTANYTV